MLVRLVTGCSWVDAERLTGGVVSDTTLRARRNEWSEAGVFDQLAEVMIGAYDAKVGLEPAEALVDGSLHKAPCGGEGTGKSPVDRGKLGWKWSIATDAKGIPMGWVVGPANRHDAVLLPATLEAVDNQGLLEEIETLHLDRGYDNKVVRHHVAEIGITEIGITEIVVPRVRPRYATKRQAPIRVPLGRRWPVERTNELVALQLRPAAPQHRPQYGSPQRAAGFRHRHPAHCQAARPRLPVEILMAPIRAGSKRAEPGPR
jgi:hypothetical protein